jgi:hypothetical protein
MALTPILVGMIPLVNFDEKILLRRKGGNKEKLSGA